MKELLDYSRLYPNLPFEICLFFQSESKNGRLINKEIFSFCEYFHKKYNSLEFPQPRVISKICDILCDNKILSVIKRSGPDNINSSYLCFLKDDVKSSELIQFHYNKKLCYIVYGFKYIYDDYKKYVLPIEYTDSSDNIALGTCFLYRGGIATAKHCVEGAKKIAIQGISEDELVKAKYKIDGNDLMDLVFIRFEKEKVDTILFSQNAEILDEVMTLGYPKIPGFHNYLTAEKVNVSSRYTASLGQISSKAKDIWIKEKLFLITAKIKGGNSGGPVINNNGSVVGVTVNLTIGEGDYDDLGYGTVIPVSFLDELISNEEERYLDTHSIEFKNFE
jgi:hypothetical protein